MTLYLVAGKSSARERCTRPLVLIVAMYVNCLFILSREERYIARHVCQNIKIPIIKAFLSKRYSSDRHAAGTCEEPAFYMHDLNNTWTCGVDVM